MSLKRIVATVLLGAALFGAMPLGQVVAAPEPGVQEPAQPVDAEPTVPQQLVRALQHMRIRSGPGTNYRKVGSLPKGKTALLLAQGATWHKIELSDGTVGYVSANPKFTEIITQTVDAPLDRELEPNEDPHGGYQKMVQAVQHMRIRSGPSTKYQVVGSLPRGQKALLVTQGTSWHKIQLADGTVGYVSANTAFTRVVTQSAEEESKVDIVLKTAMSMLGKPYRRGAEWENDRAFDCSSFTQYVFAQAGIKLPRTEDEQIKYGTPVSKANLKPGDLVFFKNDKSSSNITHVGIYVGDGKIIDAASPTRGVVYSSLSWTWYKNTYFAARRLL